MSDKIRCLIVDDEPIARQIIESYCAHFSEILIVGQCDNAFKAKSMVENQEIDLLFLDINMPVLDGVAFVKTLKNPPIIIFTTAYKEFAHEAFDLDAADYLLKPFSLERFIIAVDKVKQKKATVATSVQKINEAISTDFIFIKFEGKIHKIEFEDLLFAEAKGNNIKIVSRNITLSPSMTISSFEEMLPPTQFSRIHRSFIINKSKINLIEGNRVFIDSVEIPIGANYRDKFLMELGL